MYYLTQGEAKLANATLEFIFNCFIYTINDWTVYIRHGQNAGLYATVVSFCNKLKLCFLKESNRNFSHSF